MSKEALTASTIASDIPFARSSLLKADGMDAAPVKLYSVGQERLFPTPFPYLQVQKWML